MPDSNYTHICFVLDSSGSMHHLKSEVIKEYNKFVEENFKEEGKTTFSLYTFASDVANIYDFSSEPGDAYLSEQSYNPMGMTALNDGYGTAIKELGDKLASMKEVDRPGKIVFVTYTDGGESSSKEYSLEAVNQMIKHQTDKYDWNFVYLGSHPGARKDSQALGLNHLNAGVYSADSAGNAKSFAELSRGVSRYRSGTVASVSLVD